MSPPFLRTLGWGLVSAMGLLPTSGDWHACALVHPFSLEFVRLRMRTPASILRPQTLTTEGDDGLYV